MKKLLVIMLCFLASSQVKAQDYEKAIGVRLGFDNGVTYKQFITSISAIEGLAYFGNNYFSLTALYEINNDNAFEVEGLNWYYGAGGHIGFISKKKEGSDEQDFILGADGIVGIEYNFENAPFNVSLDWKPQINLIGGGGFVGNTGALSVRYLF